MEIRKSFFFVIEIARCLVLKKKAGEIEAPPPQKNEDANAMYYLHYCSNQGIIHVNEVSSDNSSSPKFREKLANTIY